MIYTDIQLKEKISQMMESFESEVIEFKEARTNYSFNDIPYYKKVISEGMNFVNVEHYDGKNSKLIE